MNNIYYSKYNFRGYISLIITIIGIIMLIINNMFLSSIILAICGFISEMPYNKDIFIKDGKKLYLIVGTENPIIRSFFIGILALSFAICLMKIYFVSLVVFYLLLLIVNIYNFIFSKNIEKFIKSNNLLDKEIKGYSTYLVSERYYDKGYYCLTLNNKFSNIITTRQFKLTKSFINYKELSSILKS